MSSRTPLPPPPKTPPRPRRELTEEELADAQARFRAGRSLLRSIVAIAVLTVMAAVVLIPFAYMLLVSFKAPAEVGDGRMLPAGLQSLLSRGGPTVWVRSALNDEQVAIVAGAEAMYVGPGDAARYTARALPALPPRLR